MFYVRLLGNDKITDTIHITENDKKLCRNKKLSLDVSFFLFDGSGVEGRTKKDLDNLLKIFCDVLPEFMDNVIPPKQKGLGLIDSDNSILEVHCTKIHVHEEQDEGLEFEIHEAKS